MTETPPNTDLTPQQKLGLVKALEPYKNRDLATFPVMEIFGPTIQGEGGMIGVKTMFIRFGGCDYRCELCDSMHAVDPRAVKAHARWLTVAQILDELIPVMRTTNTEWVTISGGNPVMWDLALLVSVLQEMEIKVAVETQGSIWRDWIPLCNHITISPKAPGMGERFDHNAFNDFLDRLLVAVHPKMDYPDISIKVVAFYPTDLEFIVVIDQLLNELGWDPCTRYISLGNPHPPILDEGTMTQHLDPDVEEAIVPMLLSRYKMLIEDFCQDPRLSKWIFLPQLHVLVWGNRAGV